MNSRILLSVSFAIGLALASAVTSLAQTRPAWSVEITTTFDYNSTTDFTGAYGINNHGKVVGDFDNGPFDAGYTRSAQGKLSQPIVYMMDGKAVETGVSGINSSGQVCGGFTNRAFAHGFFFKQGVFTVYDVPGSDRTYIYGENDGGDFVGKYYIGADNGTAFANLAGVVTTISVEGDVDTWARAINNAGEVCGDYNHTGIGDGQGFYRD